MDQEKQQRYHPTFQAVENAQEAVRNTELGKSLFSKYSESLVSAGFNVHSAYTVLSPHITAMLLEFFAFFAEHEERELGTKWLASNPAETDQGKSILEGINVRYKDLTRVGVKPEDVQHFWDLGFLTRHDFFLQFFCLSISQRKRLSVAAFEESNSPYPNSEVEDALDSKLDISILRFAPVGGSVSLEEDGDLPLELAFRSMFLLKKPGIQEQMMSRALEGQQSFNSQLKSALRA